MRVLHIDTGRQMRGGQYQVRLLLNGLRTAGQANALISSAGSPLSQAAAADGFPVYPAGFLSVWRESRQVDIVHAHDAKAHTLAALFGRAPFVVSRRVSFPVHRTLLSKEKYRRAARYLAVSQFVADQLYKAGLPEQQVDVVYDAVEASEDLLDWTAIDPVVAPAFPSDPQKLSELTVEACCKAGATLVLSKDLSQDLRRASMFLYLSKSEGLGSAALLAMAAGVPVIASEIEGLREVLEHDRSGLYVRNEVGEVAAAVRRVLNEPGLASRLRQAALQRVRDVFSPSQMVAGTLRGYEKALAR